MLDDTSISTRLSDALKIGVAPLLLDLDLSFCFLRPYGRNAGPSLCYDLCFPIIAGIKIAWYVFAIMLCAACIVLDIGIFLPINLVINAIRMISPTKGDLYKHNLFPTITACSILCNLSFIGCAAIDIVLLATAAILTPFKLCFRVLATLGTDGDSLDRPLYCASKMICFKRDVDLFVDMGIVPGMTSIALDHQTSWVFGELRGNNLF